MTRKPAGTGSATMPEADEGGSGPRALRRVLQIADCLARAPDGMSLAQLAATLGAPKSSLLVLLKALTEMEFALRVGDRYFIGPALFNLAGAITAQWSITPLARPIMQRLQQETGETIVLAEFDRARADVVYIDLIESTNAVRFSPKIGDRRPLYCTGAGRIILAFQDEAWRRQYLDTTEFPRITEATVTDRREIERRVERARQEGVATTSAEATDGGAGYAAPIIQRDGTVRYALLVATLAFRVREKGELYRSAVVAAAAEISRLAGYDGARGDRGSA